jgi:hypothetical protein
LHVMHLSQHANEAAMNDEIWFHEAFDDDVDMEW